jgi:hypothetical protein
VRQMREVGNTAISQMEVQVRKMIDLGKTAFSQMEDQVRQMTDMGNNSLFTDEESGETDERGG